MDTALNPKQTDPRDVLLARADEELAHAHEQIARANEEIARAEIQLSKLEHVPGNRTLFDRPAVRGLTGLLLAACIGVAAIAWQSSYGDAAQEILASWAPKQIDEALRRHRSNKILQMIAMATKAANETSAAIEKLSNEAEPPALSKDINLSTASRSDLEDLRRDLKAAEAKATTLMPGVIALIKAERDRVETYALSLHAGKKISSAGFWTTSTSGTRKLPPGCYRCAPIIIALMKTMSRFWPANSVPTRSSMVNSYSRCNARWTVTMPRPRP